MEVSSLPNQLGLIIKKNNTTQTHISTRGKVILRKRIEVLQSDMDKNTILRNSIKRTQGLVGMRYPQFGISINEILILIFESITI